MRKEWILAGLCAFVFSCGGGGGSGGSGGGSGSSPSGSSSVSLYFTDDASVYPEILVKVYEVNLCSDNACQQKVSLFANQQGLQVDLAKLNGVYQYIATTNIPQGTYNRLEVVMDKNLTITDQNGPHQAVFVPMQEKPNKPNTVQCPTDERCYIRFNGAVQPFAVGKLVVDFVLKEFEVSTSTDPWQVTEVKMKPLTPQGVQNKNKSVYLSVQSVGTNSFTGTWMGKTYTVNITQNTTCKINGINYSGSECINQITQGMCLEVKVQEDPATSDVLTAVKIESEKKQAKCMM